MQPKKSRGETANFSKSIMSTIVLLYFLGAVLGGILVVISVAQDLNLNSPVDSSMFIAHAAYLGGPTATAIGFYAWKSKAENVLKIGKSLPEQNMEAVVTALTDMEVNK